MQAPTSGMLGFDAVAMGACFKNSRRLSVAVPQGLKPFVVAALFGTAKQLGERVIPQSRKSAGAKARR